MLSPNGGSVMTRSKLWSGQKRKVLDEDITGCRPAWKNRIGKLKSHGLLTAIDNRRDTLPRLTLPIQAIHVPSRVPIQLPRPRIANTEFSTERIFRRVVGIAEEGRELVVA